MADLFAPGRIGPATIPNRVVMAAMTTRTADAEGFVTEEAMAYYRARARGGTAGFGLSIDLDGFSPADAPGVATREDTGIMASDALPALAGVGRLPDFKALEIVEFNPHKDENGKTARLMLDLITRIFLKA